MVTDGSLRQRVFKALDKNPLLTAKTLGKVLELTSEEQQYYKGYLKKLKSVWKHTHLKERGSIRSCPDEVHNVFYRGKLSVDFAKLVRGRLSDFSSKEGALLRLSGWKVSRARNRFLLFKNMLGRIRFFETGTVELFVRKPASLGKCKQLFSDAFTRNYVVTDIRVMDQFFAGLMRRFHATYKTGQRLPYMKITTFEDTHRLITVLGDRTHPDCVEIIAEYHAEVEQARRLFDELRLSLSGSNGTGGVSGPKPLGRDYSS